MKTIIAQNKKGFTLVELLVVMAVGIALFSTLGTGIIYLQNSVRLDNSIRDLKAEIQSTQNNARNSFVINDSQNISEPTLSNKKISVGWISEITNSDGSILLTKRSVYFIPGKDYIFTDLRSHVETNLKNKNANFLCLNDILYSINNGVRVSISFPNTSGENLKCSTESGEIFTTRLPAVSLDNSTEGISNCIQEIDGEIKSSIFFTSGYGEAVFQSTESCQIKIKNSNGILVNGRSIYISRKTGTLGTCGLYCTLAETTLEQEVLISPIAPPQNSCIGVGGACGGSSSCCGGLTCSNDNRCTSNTENTCASEGEKCSGTPCCGGLTCNSSVRCEQDYSPPPGDPF